MIAYVPEASPAAWDELLAGAKKFPMDWPTRANRIESIAGDSLAIKKAIVEDAQNVRILVHAKVRH